jgi:DNA helicase-2/ATP-dependent DNA helicase PcrA
LPTLIESKLGLLANAARRARIAADQTLLRDLASEIEWSKVSNIGPDDYARLAPQHGRSVSGQEPEAVARLFAGYESVKRDQGRMDMEDVLLLTAGLLAEDERVAAQVRRQYKWFVVDEFQDVSPLQSALLDLWLGGRDEICVVGDPAQTIYSFAGANSSYLSDFPSRYPRTISIDLVRNYRSTPQIVLAANTLLSVGTTRGVELRAERDSGPEVSYTPYPDEVAEAEGVAARIARLRESGLPLSEIAILLRINAQTEAFEDALSGRRIPYSIRGAARFFERPEVKQAVTLLRGAARSGTGDADLVDEVRATVAGMGWSPESPMGRGQTRDRWESLQALVDQAVAFAGSPEASLNAFVDDLDRRASEQHAPVAEGVTVSTLHAAKGLEWDAVFVCGVHEGTLPIVYATTPAGVEEERRLLYVGITRARRDLAISWAAARNPGGRANRQPSRFLDRLLPATSTARAAAGPGGAKGRNRRAVSCRECGRALATGPEKKRGRCVDCPASYDEALFEELRAWRLRRASEESVPAFVVFTDATLQLIAEHRPTSMEGLLKINGVGKTKIERYGEDLLGMLA